MKKRFFHHQKPATASKVASIFAGILAVAKLLLYFKTGLLIVALSAFDSAIDVCVSYFNNRVITFARQSADDDHPYGHGKAESLAAMAQGMLISCAALGIFFSSIRELIFETAQSKDQEVLFISGLFFVGAAFFSWIIFFFLKKSAIRFNSAALHGDSQHYFTDVYANLGSALAIFAILKFEKMWLDPTIATLIALYMLWNGYKLIRKSFDELMDHDIPADIKQKALKLILETNAKIQDVHRLRGRYSGDRLILDFHISLPQSLAFKEAHDIADAIEKRLEDELSADVTVHVDPIEDR